MGIVQLDGHLVWKVIEGVTDRLPGSELRGLVTADDILQRGGAHEVLLLQTQLLALEEVVIGVQDTGNVLSQITVQHGLDVVTIVDWRGIKKGLL